MARRGRRLREKATGEGIDGGEGERRAVYFRRFEEEWESCGENVRKVKGDFMGEL